MAGQHEQREGHRGDALGAEPRHEGTRGPVGSGSRQRDEHGRRPCGQHEERGDAHGCQPVVEEAAQREQRAEHHEDPQLDHLDQVLSLGLERRADVGPQDAEHDRADERGDQPVAVRREDSGPVGGERDPQGEERLLVRADLRAQCSSDRHQARRQEPHRYPHPQPDRHVLEHEPPPVEVAAAHLQSRDERHHGGQRQPVVEA